MASGTARSGRSGLSTRHLNFIALGSAIGTGLFYGSAGAIQAAGPSVLLVYLLGGAVVYFLLRALGEMSVHHPVTGSFAEYTRAYLGGAAGYLTGWMFAFEMVIVALADLTAIGIYMGFWFPDVSRWVWIVAALLVVGAANVASAKAFGELEFWFTVVKVGAVIAMILAGAAVLVFGLSTAETTGPVNLVNDGGFFPNGLTGMVASFILVLFAFGGTEIIGVAGSEASDPKAAVPKAVNTVPVRILLFYVLSILVILMINPWRTITGDESPFVQIFSTLGVNWAAGLLNFVVITAALSAINADLFGAGRVLTGLAKQNYAPRVMARTIRDVPVMTTVILLLVLVVGVVANTLVPDRIFDTIASLATFATIFVWLMILLAHLASRRQMTPEEVAALDYKTPLYPYGQYFAIAFILFTFGIMVWLPDFRVAFVVGLAFSVITVALYFITGRHKLPEPELGIETSRN
ncbi:MULTISPECIES: amino acid permease [unclassified Corynebacterium]|uniref:amino acid permease n=1 Tax=unclassified Corynebacterium TaxID=2624378 RepID=UPI0021AABEBF|nr:MULTISPECIES: amino acid permease [unclassified Corynebacterium]MCT1453118.1 amino acid permease [Corynebacterium sp. p3-SID1145]MCT1462229.1 amino acid permease [Corynebacterium sp. p3-SID1140]MDN8595486.1 amino acid permease [Corynebacterium sp. P4_F2]WKK55260.1 amino acid permease [Corynebacterium sp. P4-C1]WKK62668.1 amino acid permease [Corynebacterium sp. P8-C1]